MVAPMVIGGGEKGLSEAMKNAAVLLFKMELHSVLIISMNQFLGITQKGHPAVHTDNRTLHHVTNLSKFSQ